MIASASDDMTIRIWGTRQQAEQQQCYLEEKEAKMIAEDQKNQSKYDMHAHTKYNMYTYKTYHCRDHAGSSNSLNSLPEQEAVTESTKLH